MQFLLFISSIIFYNVSHLVIISLPFCYENFNIIWRVLPRFVLSGVGIFGKNVKSSPVCGLIG